MEALNEQFGTAAEFDDPPGGIFLWVKLPDNVDTMKLYNAALAAGVAINPGPNWSADKAWSKSRMRLCFASPSHEEIREGIAVLAEICRKEFGVPARSANVERRRGLSGHGPSPASSRSSTTAAPGREAEFEAWFQGEHLIERLAVPGFLFGRRHKAISGCAGYFNFYLVE